MRITNHVCERFLQRVCKMASYSQADLGRTRVYLEKLLGQVQPGGNREFALPEHKGFLVIHRENTAITLLDKKEMTRQRRRRGMSKAA